MLYPPPMGGIKVTQSPSLRTHAAACEGLMTALFTISNRLGRTLPLAVKRCGRKSGPCSVASFVSTSNNVAAAATSQVDSEACATARS